MTNIYALPDVDIIILDFFFKSAYQKLSEALPDKEKLSLILTISENAYPTFHEARIHPLDARAPWDSDLLRPRIPAKYLHRS